MDKITCGLTEDEIEALIKYHGLNLTDDTKLKGHCIERVNYLHKRLTSKGKAEEPKQEQTASGW